MQLATLVLAAASLAGGYAGGSIPGTLELETRAIKKAKDFTFDQLYDMTLKFLDNFMSPNNSIQVSAYANPIHQSRRAL